MTIIVTCKCACPQQDKMYGTGKRVANYCGKTQDNVRCTSCGTVLGAGASAPKKAPPTPKK